MNHFEQPYQMHDTLNPVLWEHNDIKKSVQIALLQIAKAYWKFLKIDTKIYDIVVTGSQANYSYSPHSDIDLHIIVEYDSVSCDLDVDNLFDTKRKLWNEQHKIDIHGIPVEVYVEDSKKPATGAAYSLLKNQWIRNPKKVNTSIDTVRIEDLCLSWIRVITAAIKSRDLEQCRKVKDMLWSYRKLGLSAQGELGVPNLVFKTLRNSGITEKLLDAVRYLDDQKLSLESH